MELLVRLPCHILDVDDLLTSSNISPSLTKLRRVAVKVDMQLSSHIFPIDTRASDCRWRTMWSVCDAWVKRGFRLRSALWVACMMLTSGRITWGPLLIFCLLLHGVFNLM